MTLATPRRLKQLLILAAAGAVVAAFGAANFWSLRQVAQDGEHIANINLSNSLALSRMRAALMDIGAGISRVRTTEMEPGEWKSIQERLVLRIREYEQEDAKYRAIPFVAGEAEVYAAVDHTWEQIRRPLAKIATNPAARPDLNAPEWQQMNELRLPMLQAFERLNAFHDRQADFWSARISSSTSSASSVSMGLIAVEVFLAVVFGALLSRTISRRMEAETRKQERRLQDVFDAMPHYVFIRDRERKIIAFNRAMKDLVGIPAGPGATERVLAIFGGPRTAQAHREDWDVLLKGSRVVTNASYRLPDGQLHHFHLVKTPLRNERGLITGMVGVLTDMTPQVLAEQGKEQLRQQLERARKLDMIGQLTAGVAHDFNNLLMTVGGTAAYLQFQLSDRKDVSASIASIQQASQRGADLVRRLLMFARSETAPASLLSLNDIITGTVSMLERVLDTRITIVTAMASDLHLTRLDRSALEDTLLNLAVNARDAMPEGGRLTFSTRNVSRVDVRPALGSIVSVDRFCHLTVADTGAGMSEEILRQVFEPFFSTKAPGKGTGLGLSSVKEFVEAAGGFVFIESGVGTGTAVHLYLPADEQGFFDNATTNQSAASVVQPPVGDSS